jgi:hypothetical protein
MSQLSEFSRVRNRTVFAGLLMAVFLIGLFAVTGPNFMDQPAFAGEQSQVSQESAAENMPPSPGEKGRPSEACDDPPVLCVGVPIAQNPFPGCTSGERCSLPTTGKSCGMLYSGKKCQTVNNGSGVCSCQCIK